FPRVPNPAFWSQDAANRRGRGESPPFQSTLEAVLELSRPPRRVTLAFSQDERFDLRRRVVGNRLGSPRLVRPPGPPELLEPPPELATRLSRDAVLAAEIRQALAGGQ